MELCVCSSGQSFEDCCGKFHSGDSLATSPEQLMRSRYAAFVKKDFDYLYQTHDPQTRVPGDQLANSEFANSVQFTGLQVLSSEENGNKGRVEFIASYTNLKTGEPGQHHELSQFRKQAGVWLFRSGKLKA